MSKVFKTAESSLACNQRDACLSADLRIKRDEIKRLTPIFLAISQ